MKRIKHYTIVSVLLIFSISHGMKRAYSQDDKPVYYAKVQTYFSPGDRKAMKDDIFSLIDNATQSIYIAMYWITDDSLIDRMIAAKQRNVTVGLYLDESSIDRMQMIEKLLQNDITPIVFPSKLKDTGIMHDKFFIIDTSKVVTGSANFTRPAFDDNLQKFNYENVVILESFDIASQYLKNFVDIQVEIFNLYIDMIADYESKDLPAWFHKLFPILFKQGGRLVQTFWRRMDEMNDLQRDRVNKWRTETLKV